jgi:octaprenyl-diphosphate synthase
MVTYASDGRIEFHICYPLIAMQLPAHTDMSTSAPHNNVPAFRLIDHELKQVTELINEQLSAPVGAGDINRLLEYLSGHSGKMIRPGLVLLSYRAILDVPSEKKMQNEAIRVAAIIEMIHNATLLHDDVIDEGQKRRGLPTINSLWGNETAVLLGDFLLSKVFKMCAESEPRVAKVISAAAVRLCEGELRQVVQKQNWHLSESQYIEIIAEKSAALFSSACYLGGILAQGNEGQARSLADFGLNAGIAFQITDDLLDIVGDESKTGKTLGSDVDKNKLTLALIHLLRVVEEKEQNAIINSCLEGKDSQNDKSILVEILKRYGSLEYAQNRAQEFITAAVQSLAGLKHSDAKDALIATAEFMTGRAG